MSWYSNTVVLHGAVGSAALLSFWIAGASKKGGPTHKAAGKVYLLTMVGILISALPMAIFMLLTKSQVGGAFFLYLVVITSTSVWNSWRAIVDKRNWQRYVGPFFKTLMLLNLLAGLAIAAIGIFFAQQMQLIITSFSLVGILGAIKMYRFQRAAPSDPRWWMQEHLSAMIGNGVATHIAFLSIGLPKLLPVLSGPVLQNTAWLGPLMLALIAGTYLTRKYLPKRA